MLLLVFSRNASDIVFYLDVGFSWCSGNSKGVTLLGEDDQCLSSWNRDNGVVGAGVGLKVEDPRDR